MSFICFQVYDEDLSTFIEIYLSVFETYITVVQYLSSYKNNVRAYNLLFLNLSLYPNISTIITRSLNQKMKTIHEKFESTTIVKNYCEPTRNEYV